MLGRALLEMPAQVQSYAKLPQLALYSDDCATQTVYTFNTSTVCAASL